MTAAGVSPSSSPRLPSPPPFTEVQIGPKSPSVGESFGQDAVLGVPQANDDGSTRRIRPGTKAVDMAFGPPLIPLAQLDSPFQLQEHLKALYNHYTRPEDSDTVIPINRQVAIQLAEPPEGVDRSLWLYELCRFLTMKVNNLIIAFFAETPPCSSHTCPEMRASEWQYLCAVHDPPKSCCAIDYCCHTLDWATNILTSPKYFPSRLTLGSEAGGGPQASMRHLTNIFRRLYRIFAHAWFQHREVFWQVEGSDGLYVFFKTVCDMYALIPEDNYTVPAEAEGLDTQPVAQEAPDARRLTILRKEDENPFQSSLDGMEASSISTGATTRRHKHTPSTGSRVSTIAESVEDNDDKEIPPLSQVQEEVVEKAESQSAAEAAGGNQLVSDDDKSTITVEEVRDETQTENPAADVSTQPLQPEREEPTKPEESNLETDTAKPEGGADTTPTEEEPPRISEPETPAEKETEEEKEAEPAKAGAEEGKDTPETKPESEQEPTKET